MKTILSFIVLAMAVLVMGCGEPTTTEPGADGVTANSPAAGDKCGCCTDCDKCDDGEKCECTAKKGEECSCKCASKDGDEEMASKDDDDEDGDDHEGHDHEGHDHE
ncbi:hypothetical protein N9Y42_05555 [Mariniblastus sp.]|nr:hypothetical protein [Mariniblastus sp.]